MPGLPILPFLLPSEFRLCHSDGNPVLGLKRGEKIKIRVNYVQRNGNFSGRFNKVLSIHDINIEGKLYQFVK